MKHILVTTGEKGSGLFKTGSTNQICDACDALAVPWRGFDLDDRNASFLATWGKGRVTHCPVTHDGALPLDAQGTLDLEQMGARMEPLLNAIFDDKPGILIVDLGANGLRPFIRALEMVGFPDGLPVRLILNFVVRNEADSAALLEDAWNQYGSEFFDWMIIKNSPDASYGVFDHHAADTVAEMVAAGALVIEPPKVAKGLYAQWERTRPTTMQAFAQASGLSYLVLFQWQKWLNGSRAAFAPLIERLK